MKRYTKKQYLDKLIKRGLSEQEAEKYYIDIHRARRKYQRLKSNEDVLFVPNYSLSPAHITSYEVYLQRNRYMQDFLSRNYSVNINKEIRRTFLSNLEDIYSAISIPGDTEITFQKIEELVNNLSNRQLQLYFREHNLYEVLFYADDLESFLHDLNIKANDIYRELSDIKNGKTI